MSHPIRSQEDAGGVPHMLLWAVFSLYMDGSPGGVFCKFLRVRELDAFSCTVISRADRFRRWWLFRIGWIPSFGSAEDRLSRCSSK